MLHFELGLEKDVSPGLGHFDLQWKLMTPRYLVGVCGHTLMEKPSQKNLFCEKWSVKKTD